MKYDSKTNTNKITCLGIGRWVFSSTSPSIFGFSWRWEHLWSNSSWPWPSEDHSWACSEPSPLRWWPAVLLSEAPDRLLLILQTYPSHLSHISLMNACSPSELSAQGEPDLLIPALWTSTYWLSGSAALWGSQPGNVLSSGIPGSNSSCSC